MKHGSLSRIFWGLLLLFFNINIFNLNLLTTFIGALLIATAMWQLRKESKNFRFAFIFSVIQLAIQSLGLILACSQMSEKANISIVITVIGSINMIALLYNLFSGLQQLVLAVGGEVLGKKLHNCFVLYVILVMLTAITTIITSLIIIVLPFALIAFIYILVQVSRANHTLDDRDDIFQECKLNGRYFAMLGGYLGLTALICFTFLLLKSRPIVQTEIYNRVDSGNQADIKNIRSKMLKWGFEKEIVNDLPDSEVNNYKNCLSADSNANYQSIDGGTLKITQCTSNFKNYKIRLLFYYKWTAIPNNQFCDKLSVDLNSNMFSIANDMNFNGFGLFDKKTEKGLTTYKADFVKDDSTDSVIHTITPTVSYRVFAQDQKNQRGFFAYNIQASNLEKGMTFESIINYYHQKSLFNFVSTSTSSTVSTNQQQLFNNDYPYGYAFDKSQFYTAEEYNPNNRS